MFDSGCGCGGSCGEGVKRGRVRRGEVHFGTSGDVCDGVRVSVVWWGCCGGFAFLCSVMISRVDRGRFFGAAGPLGRWPSVLRSLPVDGSIVLYAGAAVVGSVKSSVFCVGG